VFLKEFPYSGGWGWVNQNVVLAIQVRPPFSTPASPPSSEMPFGRLCAARLPDAAFRSFAWPTPPWSLHQSVSSIPLQLQDTPAPLLDWIIFAVVRRIIQELNWLVNVVSQLHHARQKLRTSATARAIVHFDVQRLVAAARVHQSIPLGRERIDEVTRL
jgi:hypothetical protein